MLLFIKGLIIGMGKIIPGVSGSVLAISLNVYESCLKAVSNIFKNFKDNLKLLVPIGLGIFTSVVLTSKLVIYLLDNYYLSTMLLFIGLIIGGIPIKKIQINNLCKKDYFVFFLALSFCLLSFIEPSTFMSHPNTIVFFLIGIIDAVTMVIPGISGTAVMMLLGCYDMFMETVSSLMFIQLIPCIIGLIIGVILVAKLIQYLLENEYQTTYCGIIGFSISSVIMLLFTTFNRKYNIYEVIISLLLLVLGFIISKKFEE